MAEEFRPQLRLPAPRGDPHCIYRIGLASQGSSGAHSERVLVLSFAAAVVAVDTKSGACVAKWTMCCTCLATLLRLSRRPTLLQACAPAATQLSRHVCPARRHPSCTSMRIDPLATETGTNDTREWAGERRASGGWEAERT